MEDNKNVDITENEVKTEETKEVKETDKTVELENKIKELEEVISQLSEKEENEIVDEIETEEEKEERKNEIETKLKELEDKFAKKEAELKEKELKLLAQEKLSEKGLDKDFVKYLNLNCEDIDKMIDEISEVVNKQIKSATEDVYKPANYNIKGSNISKEDFKKMDYMEKQELFLKNKELYRKLSE